MADDSSKARAFGVIAQGLGLLTLLQIGCGLYLGTAYRPTLAEAHPSTTALRDDAVRAMLVGFHYWGSALLIAASALLLFGMLWTGAYASRARQWYGVLCVVGAALGIQITGNLLPMDRHDVQTVVIEAGIASRTPAIGTAVGDLMLQGERFGQSTLDGWYFAHKWLFTGLLAFGFLLLLPGSGRSKGRGWMVLLPAIAAAAAAFLARAPYGPPAEASDFDQQSAVVSWYVWPLHGALKAADSIFAGQGWVGSALLPALLGLFLLSLPIAGKRFGVWGARAVFLLFAALFGAGTALYAGPPAPIAGLQDVPAAETPAVSVQAEPIDSALAAKGKEHFRSMPCGGCHGLDASGGRDGPSLLKVHEKHADAEWYIKFVKNPSSVKPGSVMPAFDYLDDETLRQLAEYLRGPK